MPLHRDMTLVQIEEYLKDDLAKSIRNDIGPMVQPEQAEGGYFGVCRMVLCYVDYLGALYHGYTGEEDSKGRPRIAKSEYAISFLKEVWTEIDPLYKDRAELLYNTYRHGTVHLYQPKVLVNNKRYLAWLVYKGDREACVSFAESTLRVRHLQPVQIKPDLWYFPVSISVLYSDLLQSIDAYIVKLRSDPSLVQRFAQTANALIQPEQTELVWWENGPHLRRAVPEWIRKWAKELEEAGVRLKGGIEEARRISRKFKTPLSEEIIAEREERR